MNEKISVIIPVYNVEEYLTRCLHSVIENTYDNLEIICIDDGSTDNCNKILHEFATLDSRISIIKKENGGLSSARNAGLRCCSGEFVSFVDSDDWIHPMHFETLLRIQNEYNSDIVISDLKSVSEKKEFENFDISDIPVRELTLEQIYSNHDTKSYVTGRLFRREIIENTIFPEGIVLEDAIFNAIVMCKSSSIKVNYIPIAMYYYFQRTTSLVHKINGVDLIKLSELYLKYLLAENDQKAKKIFAIETIKRTLFARYVISFSKNYKSEKRNCNNILKTAIKQLGKIDSVSIKNKIKYFILYRFPQAYRLFRIISDPTMLDWEKNLKKD